MKICILSNQARSMAIFWRVLILELLAEGFEVICAAPAGDLVSDKILTDMGTCVFHYKLDRKGLNPLKDIGSFLELKKLFFEESPDILFATTIKPVIYGCLAAHNARVAGIFATITGLGYAFERDGLFKKIVNRVSTFLYRNSLKFATAIFFQNKDDEQLFRKSGILSKNSRVFLARGTGVDTQYFYLAPFPPLPPKGSIIFVLIGRLLQAKGLDDYAQAAAMLKIRYPNAQFQLLGPYEYGPGSISETKIKHWSAAGCIDYLGETRDVRPYIASAHVVVLPSWREGVPTSIMEAMSMGRPCVATDVPGCREVVHDGVNGWLAQCCNPQSLAAAMEKFLLDPASISVMGKNSRDIAVKDFDAKAVARGIIADMLAAFCGCEKRNAAERKI